MKPFRIIFTLGAVFSTLVVGVGGLVRATGSGLGCLDEWPSCRGGWTVPADATGIIEYSHRAAAGILVLILIAGVIAAFRQDVRPGLRRAAIACLLVVFLQAALGREVVAQSLHATFVTAHLLLGLALVGLTTGIAVSSALGTPTTPKTKLARMSRGALGAVALLFLVGAFVRERGAGLAFQDWPLMNGGILPNFTIEAETLQWTHRILAVLLLGHIYACFSRARKEGSKVSRTFAGMALSFYIAQIFLGGANVLSDLAPAMVIAHVVGAALVWASLVGLAVASRRDVLVPSRREEVAVGAT